MVLTLWARYAFRRAFVVGGLDWTRPTYAKPYRE
jgi:hypothetical protein